MKKIIACIGLIVLIAVPFAGGWYVRDKYFTKSPARTNSVRLSGFDYIKPLLICDTNPERKYPELTPLENKIKNLISSQEKAGDIKTASVFFFDLKTNGKIDVNQDEKFYPASLTKVSVMIMIYKIAEIDPTILSKEIKNTNSEDLNAGQEIKPQDYAKTGQTYTVNELIEKMVKYSDNNSFQLLVNLLNETTAQSFFNDLQIPFPNNSPNQNESNSMTTNDISYLFRVLYNATYLTREFSEKGLQLLSQTDFRDGLVAGLPSDTGISHKFGAVMIKDQATGNIVERQLHDCGIIYHSKDPYLLCVMTKSSSDLKPMEDFIKNVSQTVYQEVDKYAQ